jgi:uncharacterized protein DUF3810
MSSQVIRQLVLMAVIVMLAGIAALIPMPARFVETWYAAGLYPSLQTLLTFASNAVPLALLDVLIVTIVAAFALLTVRDLRASRGRGWVWRGGLRAIAWGASLYIAFLLLWGFNYRRMPLQDRLAFDPAGVTPEAAARLAATVVDRVNALYAPAHAGGFGSTGAIDPALAGAFDRVARTLSNDRRFVAGRPKRSMLDWYFQRAGVSGMTDPYFLETLVAGDLLPFERPFVVAHEWAHLAGLADEGEANLAGWLTCLRGSPAHQYSGWLSIYSETIAALPPPDRTRVAAKLQAGPRGDLRAIRDRLARHVNARVASAGWRVYDSYLKANRVEAGARSYDEVVRLVLGLEVARQAMHQAAARR